MILAYEVLGLVPGGGFGAGSGVGFASSVQFIQARDNFAGILDDTGLESPSVFQVSYLLDMKRYDLQPGRSRTEGCAQ
jgi:hypothetical protein